MNVHKAEVTVRGETENNRHNVQTTHPNILPKLNNDHIHDVLYGIMRLTYFNQKGI